MLMKVVRTFYTYLEGPTTAITDQGNRMYSCLVAVQGSATREEEARQTCVLNRMRRVRKTGFAIDRKVSRWVLWLLNSPINAYTMR